MISGHKLVRASNQTSFIHTLTKKHATLSATRFYLTMVQYEQLSSNNIEHLYIAVIRSALILWEEIDECCNENMFTIYIFIVWIHAASNCY